jgi:hypothetical protein
MAIELTSEVTINTQIQTDTSEKKPTTIKDLLQTRKAGHTIGMLIAERRHNRAGENHAKNINHLTRRLKPYEGILADPFNTNRRLNITRLIACIDGRRR